MRFGTRIILWVGNPCRLLRVSGWAARPSEPKAGPAVLARGADTDWTEAEKWLAASCRPGSEIDVIYESHLLRVETFPSLGEADRPGALRARLLRDLVVPSGELLLHAAWLDTGEQTQAVVAAVLESTHQTTRSALEAAGMKLGRVGFAGQLALRALERQGAGCWTIVTGMGDAGKLLLARSPEGLLLGAPLATDDARERLALWMPRRSFEEAPRSVAEPAVEKLAPVFSREPEWRIGSRADVEYPFYFSRLTWSAAAAMFGLVVYSGWLAQDVQQREAAAGQIRRMRSELELLAGEEAKLARRLEKLQMLSQAFPELGAAVFDNGGWLRFLGQLRDRHARSMLFESISIAGAQMLLTGSHGGAESFLRLYERLSAAVGQGAVKLKRFEGEKSGRTSFAIQIDRRDAQPPQLAEETEARRVP